MTRPTLTLVTPAKALAWLRAGDFRLLDAAALLDIIAGKPRVVVVHHADRERSA